MADDGPAPDFAMLRAVEILARIHENARTRENTPPPPLTRPVVLQSDRITFTLGTTNRETVERELGIAFSYPARGWHTYGTRESGRRALLSAFYSGGTLVAAEVYVPRSERAPALQPAGLGGFRLEPGGVCVGMSAGAVPDTFCPAVGGPAKLVYESAFEARFEGGVAYAMTRAGIVERIAIYANRQTAPA